MRRAQVPGAGEVPRERVEQILGKTRTVLVDEEQEIIRGIIESYYQVTEQLREQRTTAARLRRFLGMRPSEKTATVLCAGTSSPSDTPPVERVPSQVAESAEDSAVAPESTDKGPRPTKEPPKAKGHGRVPASAYPDAPCLPVLHASLRAGEKCPRCGRGRLYELKEPARILRIVGQPPLAAVCWNCQRLRCSGCGHIFVAAAPEAAKGPKYDETAVAMMALLRYRAGLPLNRLDHLERNLQTPVPASTQWDVVSQGVGEVRPVFDELSRQAAQGEVVHNDDSYARILAFMGKRRAALLAKGELPDAERTGLFTTAIVSVVGDKPIALFFTGRKHAGENLTDLLKKRATGRAAPLLMSDALDRNVPKGHAVVEANCLAHGRRHVVDEVENFPTECERMLRLLRKVYRVDHLCRRFGLLPEPRLRVHQRFSGPVMEQLRAWMTTQLAEKRIEPNSGLGQAMNYLLKRWDKFTRFLHVAGAPLDNNICERALKMAIRHRNNSLFYKSQRGANVGDVYMTLIHTAELHGENPFAYLTALLHHAKAVAECPAAWLPWNYRETLAKREAREVRCRDPVAPEPPPIADRPAVRRPFPAMTAAAPVAQPSL
ncbi:MAG: IS66 family transposase [Candidatus Aenigmarchaeota archaeon]|nr:IS66 family transposase [Candidatus Aenigmarchaeota archaeon]